MMGIYDWLNKKKEPQESQEIEVIQKKDFSSFDKITNYIYKKSGITDLNKRSLTSSRLQQYALSRDIHTTDDFLSKIQDDYHFYQEIINIATVNETFFFREIKELTWLISHIKSSTKSLSILSMPCSTGEEIYSILLMMDIEGIDLSKVTIRGYDINSEAIKKAKNGEYNEHSLHKLTDDIKKRYFTKLENKNYQIATSIKNSASFTQNNIFDLVGQKEKFDIVLSRNMFIYFNDKKREEALNIIASLLKDGGIYIKGHADHIKPHPNLKNLEFGIYKKII